MKLSIVKPSDQSGQGQALIFDSATGESKLIGWSVPLGSRFIRRQWVEGDKAYGILSDNPTPENENKSQISASFIGLAGDGFPPVNIYATPTGVESQGELIGLDGQECFAQSIVLTGEFVANIKFASAPFFVNQPYENFELVNKALMKFSDGHSRVVTFNASAGQVSLSTPLGSGQTLTNALTTPYVAPSQAGVNIYQLLARMALVIDDLGVAASVAGLGSYTYAHPWVINTSSASPLTGQIKARDKDGNLRACFLLPTQVLTIYELVVDANNDVELVYEGVVTQPDGWGFPSYRLSLDEKPGVFWHKFVRSFEEDPA